MQSIRRGLERQVLKDVSRSFYLSLRFLPEGFRRPASLGYLLARASDTIADVGDLTVGERRELLADYRAAVLHGGSFQMREVNGLPRGEAVLMGRIDDCLSGLAELPTEQQAAVKKVVKIITKGQTWDLERFEGADVVRLESDDELRKYTYEVAGCVGEFWTEIGFLVEEEFASRSFVEMNELGRAYGRSLQLINILRDVPEDLENGRCYLPGTSGFSKDDLLRERGRWIAEALAGLDQAEEYARALYGKRMRFATILPAMIGRETLIRLRSVSWEDWAAGVKVTRPEVKRMMWDAVKFAL